MSFASVDNRLHVFEESPSGAFAEVQVIDDPNQQIMTAEMRHL